MAGDHTMAESGIGKEPESFGRGRVEALSDGVFAIVLTLLVLEIKVPHVESDRHLADLAPALVALAPKVVRWVVSFITVCVIWLNHHRLFSSTARVDHGFFWNNANLLLWTSFIPFPTALMGDYPDSRLAVSFYGIVMFLMALAFVILRFHLLRQPERLHPHVDRSGFRTGTTYSIVMGPLAYAVAAALSWLSPPAAFACYAAIPLYFVFPHETRIGRNQAASRRSDT
jgi:uncharacterized membrane protein